MGLKCSFSLAKATKHPQPVKEVYWRGRGGVKREVILTDYG